MKRLSKFAPWPCLSSGIAFFHCDALSSCPILMMYYTYTSLKKQFALMMCRHTIDHASERARGGGPWRSITQALMPSTEKEGNN